MTWTITTTTTILASRAVTLAERITSEPIKFIVLHPGTGAGGTVTIWDDLGRSVSSTRVDALSPRHEAEFYSDRRIFNVSAAIDGNATLDGAGASVYLVSREAPEPSITNGSTSFAGPLQAPNIRTVDWLRRSRARMWSDPVGYAVWGSSSGEFGSTKNVLAGTNVAFAETPAGFMTAFQQRGADWDLIWNGAVDGSASQTILAKIKSDWPTVAGKFDVAILASGFNDLTDLGYSSTFTRGNIAESVQWLIRGGVNVVIVLPFARNPSPTPLSWYAEHAAWCHAYAQANSAYPGQIMVADLQENLLVNGVTDAATYLNGNVHLNPIGAAVAVEGPSWDALAAAYGGINQFADPLAYGGTLIHQIDPATATATNATVAADDPAPDGRPQWLITATANLGKIASGALTLDTTKQHRIFLDADIVAAPISVNDNAYMDGVKLNSSNNIRFGIYPIPGGGLASYVRRDAGRRLRGFSRRFIPASTGVTMEYWPGGAGWQMRLRSAALIQVEP